MTAHFFVEPDQVGADTVVLNEEDSRHLTIVLRARPGHSVTIADGRGKVWQGSFQRRQGESAVVALLDHTVVAMRRPAFTVVHALPKQRKLDEVVQRLTELGVSRIVPVHSARSQVELDDHKAAKAVQRWRAIAVAAAKQSRRAYLPVIDEVGEWSAAFSSGAPGIVFWEESRRPLREALTDVPPADDMVVGIGPEGGLSPDEIAATGLPDASLGATVLRTETAAVVAVAALSFHYGLMEPG